MIVVGESTIMKYESYAVWPGPKASAWLEHNDIEFMSKLINFFIYLSIKFLNLFMYIINRGKNCKIEPMQHTEEKRWNGFSHTK